MAQDLVLSRRQLIKLGGIVAASTWGMTRAYVDAVRPAMSNLGRTIQKFRFVQLTDPHIGYSGMANRDVEHSLGLVLRAIKSLEPGPDFLVVTGDLIQGNDSERSRIQAFLSVRRLIESIGLPVHFVPGEHDSLYDRGKSYQKVFGPLHYAFDHKGARFLALDNVSQGFFLGRSQITWVKQQLQSWQSDSPVVVLCHAPLYDLFVPWNWYTFDGQALLRLLGVQERQVLVLFGHIHQTRVHRNGLMTELGALPTSWPYPEPGSMVRLESWPQSASHPLMGLGFRIIDIIADGFSVRNVSLEGGRAG